jgi:hypothetical protein
MPNENPVRVGVFQDVERARRVVVEARANGLQRITVIVDDPNVQETFRHLCDDVRSCPDPVRRTPAEVSFKTSFLGAGLGLVLGFVAVWLLDRAYGSPGAILNVSIPLAGLIWGAFIGAMLSRAYVRESENFFDQELGDGEILVAMEGRDPAQLALAERILRGTGAAPIALPEG